MWKTTSCITKKTDLHIGRNTDFDMNITVTHPDGSAFGMDGYQVKMQVRPSVTSQNVLDELSTENGKMTVTDNVITAHFTHEANVNFPAKSVYDVYLISPTGKYSRILEGTIITSHEVTAL